MSAAGRDLTSLAFKARDGDRRALTAFVVASQGEIWRFCAHAGSRDEADDLTQEVYLRALPALARFEGRSSARTWLFTIAHHVCADNLRRRRRRWPLARRPTAEGSAVVPAPASGEPGAALDVTETVASLEPERRAAFVLTQLFGLGYAEAAEVCGCPVGTIRSRVARAREALVRQLDAAAEA